MSTGVAISSVTLSASTSSISFNNIPQTYTDLVLVFNGTHTGAGLAGVYLDKINTDGSTKYSRTIMYGTGSTVGADRSSDSTSANIGLINSTMSDSTFHFMDYANTKTFKTILARSNSASGQVRAGVALWRNISAITSFGLSGVTFAAGSTFSLYGINAENSGQAKATGGDSIYRDASYWYHIFNKSGTFTPAQNLSNVDYLVIAGGGGGGNGGGGAGGYRTNSSSMSSNIAYTITVGAGGTNAKGSNSSIAGSGFTTFSSTGGGRGGSGATSPTGYGLPGGSGGGAANDSGAQPGAGNEGGYTPVEGYSGGGRGGSSTATGGGGGSGGVGQDGGAQQGGNGGPGTSSSITGTAVTRAAGGGGGGSTSGGDGGGGGAGTGQNGYGAAATSGASNTGSGGGGGWGSAGGSGGSGIIVLRYPV